MNFSSRTDCNSRVCSASSAARRVIGKAEVMAAGDNPRFLATNLPARGFQGDKDRALFSPPRRCEEFYCGRGEM